MSAAEPLARDGELLLELAHRSIAFGLREGRPLPVDPGDYAPHLREPRATFVTLRKHGELRGCTGSLEARHPLVVDVAGVAYRSAFHDPRFRPLDRSELDEVVVSISILSPTEPIEVGSEAELLASLRPGVDGLVLREGALCSTFLPAVWKSLPAPRDFLVELKHKAGLSGDHWSPALRFERYTVEEIGPEPSP